MPTPITSATTNNNTTAAVQQAPRTPQEFQFAHRLLRKLTQDSKFFPEETAHRDYVWFPPRTRDAASCSSSIIIGTTSSNDDDDDSDNIDDGDDNVVVPSEKNDNDGNNIAALSLATTSTTNNNNGTSVHHQSSEAEEDIQEIHRSDNDENHNNHDTTILQQRLQTARIRQRRRTVSTPLFLDYCLRSHTADIHKRRSSRDHTSYNHSNIALTRTTNNNNTINGGGGSLSSLLGRPSSPLSFSSGKNSCHSTVNGTTTSYNTVGDNDSYDNGASPVSVCSGSVGDVAVHPTTVGGVGGMRELPFQRVGGQEKKNIIGDGEKQQPQPVGEEIVVEVVGQKEVYSGTLSRQSSFSDRNGPNNNQKILEEGETPCVVAQPTVVTTTTTTTTTSATTAITLSSSSAPATTAAPTTTITTASIPPSSSPISQTDRVYCIHEKELEFGKILGSGGFGQVRLARIRNNDVLSSSDVTGIDGYSSDAASATLNATSTDVATNNNNINNKYYAMKYLSPTKTSPPAPSTEEENDENPSIHYVTKFERAIADLTMEARFLSVLSHEHIVKLWFVSEGRLETVFNCGSRDHQDGDDGSTRRRGRVSTVKHTNNNSNDSQNNIGDGEEDEQQKYHHQHGYFLLLDALHETLHQRILHSYIPQVIDTPLRIYQTNKKSYSNNTHIAKVQLAKRLSSLKSIALALQYLHEDCNLVYRDIKPSNIGFYRRYDGGDGSSCMCGHADLELLDKQQQQQSSSLSSKCTCNYTDIPKLFDFGLAKELKSKYHKAHPAHSPNDPPTFRLTSATGSRRYMSPEVALREPYNHKADVYSFGMVLYQISALVVPFHALDMKNHEQVVAREGLRPDVTIPSKDSSVRRTRDFRRHYLHERDREKKSLMLSKRARCVWPEELNALIAGCWDEDMRKRPEMREVVKRLDACIETLHQHLSPS